MSFSSVFPNFAEIFQTLWTAITHGGWIVLVLAFIWAAYYLYRKEILHQLIANTEWVLLSIKVPRENITSLTAVENIFGQMHALHATLTFAEEYVEGREQLWYSLEIISLGGKISFVIRTPKIYRDLLEAALYSHYPSAEIAEINDYMENIEYSENGNFEMTGLEYGIIKDDVLPIKTYKDFEAPNAEEKVTDPLAGIFEALAKMQPWEFYGIQILIQPLADNEWQPRGEAKVKELVGEEPEHKFSLLGLLLTPFEAVANFKYGDLFGGGHEEKPERSQKNDWMSMTEGQKERVTLIERKIGKPGYKTKIRQIYICPKEKFLKKKPYVVIGGYRHLTSAMTNGLKPSGRIWTAVPYKFSPTLEAPYINWQNRRRKKRVLKAYRERDIHIGLPPFVFNTEEIATVYHFPITSETRPVMAAIEQIETKKAQAPVNLPVADI